MRLLIVDDEPIIRSGIRMYLTGMPSIDIVGECGSVREAVRYLRAQTVDLVLLDIKLPDGSGFDVVREIGPEVMPPVVFVTAFDSHAVEAFEVNAVDYLLKPFDEPRLRAGIERAAKRASQRTLDSQALLTQLRDAISGGTPQWAKRLAVRDGERTEFVATASIDWIESADNYVVLHCGDRTHILAETLTNLEQRLDPEMFLRIHRRRIANISRLVALQALSGGVYEAHLEGGARLITGRQYKDKIQSLIRSPA